MLLRYLMLRSKLSKTAFLLLDCLPHIYVPVQSGDLPYSPNWYPGSVPSFLEPTGSPNFGTRLPSIIAAQAFSSRRTVLMNDSGPCQAIQRCPRSPSRRDKPRLKRRHRHGRSKVLVAGAIKTSAKELVDFAVVNAIGIKYSVTDTLILSKSSQISTNHSVLHGSLATSAFAVRHGHPSDPVDKHVFISA